MTIRDREHRFVYANQAAVTHLGFGSWEELRDTSPDAIMADYRVFAQDGRPVSMDDIPSVRILRGEPAEPLLIQTVHRRTGSERWELLKSAPVLDSSGEIEATIMIIEDVTERKHAELAGHVPGAGRRRARLVAGLRADAAQRRRAGRARRSPTGARWTSSTNRATGSPVAVAHPDPARLALAEELARLPT